MASSRFGQLDLSEEEQAKKPRQLDSKKENQGGGFLQGMFGGPGKTTSPKQSKKAGQTGAEQQPVVATHLTANSRPALQQSVGLSRSNQKPAETEKHRANQQADHDDQLYQCGWVDVVSGCADSENDQGRRASQISHNRRHPSGSQSVDPISPQSCCNPLAGSHQVEGVYIKKKHREGVAQDGVPRSPQSRKRGEELTDHERQLMEAIDDRTNEKSQLVSEKYQLQEELDKTKRDVFALRHQVNTLEAEKRAKESSGNHSESERKEVDHLKQRVSELEHHLNILHEHSKKQSRTVLKLKDEAFAFGMQEEQIESYEGLIQELEERQDSLQKELSKARSELETVTKYKEKMEKELITLKEEEFRAANENDELRSQIIKFSESIRTENDLKKEVYKLENEKAELKDQLEATQAQVLGFQTDFADERRDRQVAHRKIADLERALAQQKGLYTEEKAEYSRQLAIAQQEAESMRKELDQANKELENHQATLASVEAVNQKLQKKQAKEDTDSFWREEAAKLKTQLQEAEQHLTDLMSSQEDYPANLKEAQVELLRKSLEEKTKELDKMTKRVNKLEEDTKSKKKKKKNSDAATPQESVDARNLSRMEQLYNDASLEVQEMHKELATWQARYTQLENQNRDLELQVKAMKANLKAQDKQLQRKIATTPGDPSQVSHQLQMQPHDHGQTQDIQTDFPTNDGRAVPNLPIRAAAPPIQTNTIPEFDEVTSDSASSRNHLQRPLRASHGDALPKSNPSGLSTMSQEEFYSGNLPQQQQRYAGCLPGQQMLLDAHFSSSQEVLLHRMQERQRQEEQYRQLQLQQQMQMQGAQEQQRLMEEQQLLQAQQLQQQQIQAQLPQIQREFEVQLLGQHQSSTSAKKSLFELEEKKKAVEIERQQKLAVLESEEKAVITKLIEDLELSHDHINHLDMILVQRNEEITQLKNEVFLLHNDIEDRAKLEMDLKSRIALLNQKNLSAIESEKELEARMEMLETEKQKALNELEIEKQSGVAAVQEITVSLEAEKQEKSSLQDALNKTLLQSEKMHKQSLAAIEHLQEQIKWLNKTLLLWHQTPEGRKTGDQLKHFVIREDSEPFQYGAIVAAGCFGAVHSSTIGDIRCIAKRIHDILVGRGGQQGVSEKDKMAILANFKRECTILSTARHRNVVQFMGVHYGNEEYDISLIMEHLPTDLERFLSAYREENDHQDGFKLPLSFQVSFLSDIASGLLYLHSQSIVHRDLNSGNVLLTADLQAKIADLGVSKLHQDRKWFQKLTQAPGACGYMPPEAVAKKPVYDEKLDVFSFGVLSLYIATQNFPEILEEHVPDEIHHKGEGEIFKRQEWVDALKTQEHPFHDLVRQCLLDKQRRPKTSDVVEIVRRLREAHQCTIKETLNIFAHFHNLTHETKLTNKR